MSDRDDSENPSKRRKIVPQTSSQALAHRSSPAARSRTLASSSARGPKTLVLVDDDDSDSDAEMVDNPPSAAAHGPVVLGPRGSGVDETGDVVMKTDDQVRQPTKFELSLQEWQRKDRLEQSKLPYFMRRRSWNTKKRPPEEKAKLRREYYAELESKCSVPPTPAHAFRRAVVVFLMSCEKPIKARKGKKIQEKMQKPKDPPLSDEEEKAKRARWWKKRNLEHRINNWNGNIGWWPELGDTSGISVTDRMENFLPRFAADLRQDPEDKYGRSNERCTHVKVPEPPEDAGGGDEMERRRMYREAVIESFVTWHLGDTLRLLRALEMTPVKLLREFWESHYVDGNEVDVDVDVAEARGKRSMIVAIRERFKTGTCLLARRLEEIQAMEEVETEHVFCTLCGVLVPKDVLAIVLSYFGYGRPMLENVALTCWDLYIVVYTTWQGAVWASPDTFLKIPKVVLRNATGVGILGPRSFTIGAYKKLWGSVSVDKLRKIETPGSWHPSRLFSFLKGLTAFAKSGGPFVGLEEIKFPWHPGGLLTKRGRIRSKSAPKKPKWEAFSLKPTCPNLKIVKYPVTLQWCRELVDQLRSLDIQPSEFMPPSDHLILAECSSLEHLNLRSRGPLEESGTLAAISKLVPSLRILKMRVSTVAYGKMLPNWHGELVNLRVLELNTSGYVQISTQWPPIEINFRIPNLQSLSIYGLPLPWQITILKRMTPAKYLFMGLRGLWEMEKESPHFEELWSLVSSASTTVPIVYVGSIRMESHGNRLVRSGGTGMRVKMDLLRDLRVALSYENSFREIEIRGVSTVKLCKNSSWSKARWDRLQPGPLLRKGSLSCFRRPDFKAVMEEVVSLFREKGFTEFGFLKKKSEQRTARSKVEPVTCLSLMYKRPKTHDFEADV